MTFDEIWRRQLAFNERFFSESGKPLGELSSADVSRWTKDFVLHITEELHELLRETSWKMTHRPDASRAVRANVLEEWIDCFKFLLGLAQVWGFTVEDIEAEFLRKSAIVEARLKNRKRSDI